MEALHGDISAASLLLSGMDEFDWENIANTLRVDVKYLIGLEAGFESSGLEEINSQDLENPILYPEFRQGYRDGAQISYEAEEDNLPMTEMDRHESLDDGVKTWNRENRRSVLEAFEAWEKEGVIV